MHFQALKKLQELFTLKIDTEGFIGYTRYEEYDDPTLIYIDDRDVIYKGVE